MAKVLIGILLVGLVCSKKYDTKNSGNSEKGFFGSFYRDLGNLIIDNPITNYAVDSVVDLKEYIAHGDIVNDASKSLHEFKDFAQNQSSKGLKDLGKFGDLIIDNPFTNYAVDSVEDLKEYLAHGDIVNDASKSLHEFKDFAQNQSSKGLEDLGKLGNLIIGDLGNLIIDNPVTNYAVNSVVDSAVNLKEYIANGDILNDASKSFHEFKDFSQNQSSKSLKDLGDLGDLIIDNPFTNYAVDYVEDLKEYLAHGDIVNDASKSLHEFKDFAQNKSSKGLKDLGDLGNLIIDNSYTNYAVSSAVDLKECLVHSEIVNEASKSLHELKDFAQNHPYTQKSSKGLEDLGKLGNLIIGDLGDLIIDNPVTNYAVDYVVDSVEDLKEYIAHGDIVNDASKSLHEFKDFAQNQSSKSLKDLGDLGNLIIDNPVTNYALNSVVDSAVNLKEYLAHGDIVNDASKSLHEFKDFAQNHIYNNLSYELISTKLSLYFSDIYKLYLSLSLEDFSITLLKKFKTFQTQYLRNGIILLKEITMIDLPIQYAEKLIKLVVRFDYANLYQFSKSIIQDKFKEYGVDINKGYIKYLVNAIEIAISASIFTSFSKAGNDLMKDLYGMNFNSGPLSYVNKLMTSISKSGYYAGAVLFTKSMSKELQKMVEIILIGRLSGLLEGINWSSEYFGVKSVNIIDAATSIISLGASIAIFGATGAVQFAVAQLVIDLFINIAFSSPSSSSDTPNNCSKQLQNIMLRFSKLYQDAKKSRYILLPNDIVDSILDSYAYYLACL